MGAQCKRAIGKSHQSSRFHMNHAILILQGSFDNQEFAARDNQTLPLIQVGRDDDIGNAGFIFHREEDETLCRAGPLPRNDAARCPHELPILLFAQFLRRKYILLLQGLRDDNAWDVSQP